MRYSIFVLTLFIFACGDDVAKKPVRHSDTDNQQDMGEDMPDERGDQGAACDLIDCAENSICVEQEDEAYCECVEGFEDQGGDCVPVNAAPQFTNLPGEESGMRGESDSFVMTATDPDVDDRLTFGVLDSTCPFDIQVIADTGLATWICPENTLSCTSTMQVKDDSGFTDEGGLTIHCVRSLPVFTSTPPTEAQEHTTLQYEALCEDPEGDSVTVSKAPDDTCGGTMQGTTYVFTPDETMGGTTCLLKLACTNGETTETQSSQVLVEETNTTPVITGLPHTLSVPWERSESYQVGATDSDIPAQTLTFSQTGSTCGFDVDVSDTGLVSFTCGTNLGTCTTTISVSDGVAAASGVLTTECTNATPSVSNVSISPSQPSGPGAPLTCSYTFNDADADADQSTVEWLVNGSVAATGAMFSTYGEGDQVRCRVTPKDGVSAGTPRASAAVTGPMRLLVEAGEDHSCARTQSGGLKCWGNNFYGKIGAPDTSGSTPFAPYTPHNMTSGVSMLEVGSSHTCVVHNDALKCWGAGAWGILGPGIQSHHPNPVTIFSSGVSMLASGMTHACVIHNGDLKCWGGNANGQAGTTVGNNQSFGGSPTPTIISGFSSGVTQLALGHGHSCAIQNGGLYCWGSNRSGQLGSSTNFDTETPNPTPALVPGMSSGVTEVVAGGNHTCALHNNVWKCWGSNSWSQLGRSTTTNKDYNPVAITATVGTYSEIAAGGQSTCFIQSGNLKCWGGGSFRKFNIDGISESLTTRDVFGPGVNYVGVGRQHMCAVQNNEVYCWGANYSGHLGTGSETDANLPPTLVNL